MACAVNLRVAEGCCTTSLAGPPAEGSTADAEDVVLDVLGGVGAAKRGRGEPAGRQPWKKKKAELTKRKGETKTKEETPPVETSS
jgi:hypothetical protein